MNVIFAVILPHPPIIIPVIGGKRLKDTLHTKEALEQIGRKFKATEKLIDTIVVFTPHGAVSSAAIQVYTSYVFEGDMGTFGAPQAAYKYTGDPDLAIALVRAAEEKGLAASRHPETILDHGVMVPLHYPFAAGVRKPILPIAVALWPLKKLFEFGKVLRQTAGQKGRRLAVVASADMSHRLTPDAPSGFDPAGKEFDEKLVELVRANDVEGILNFPPELADRAGQDALWSIALMLGAIEGSGLKPQVLSYEGPFGVGYMVAAYE